MENVDVDPQLIAIYEEMNSIRNDQRPLLTAVRGGYDKSTANIFRSAIKAGIINSQFEELEENNILHEMILTPNRFVAKDFRKVITEKGIEGRTIQADLMNTKNLLDLTPKELAFHIQNILNIGSDFISKKLRIAEIIFENQELQRSAALDLSKSFGMSLDELRQQADARELTLDINNKLITELAIDADALGLSFGIRASEIGDFFPNTMMGQLMESLRNGVDFVRQQNIHIVNPKDLESLANNFTETGNILTTVLPILFDDISLVKPNFHAIASGKMQIMGRIPVIRQPLQMQTPQQLLDEAEQEMIDPMDYMPEIDDATLEGLLFGLGDEEE